MSLSEIVAISAWKIFKGQMLLRVKETCKKKTPSSCLSAGWFSHWCVNSLSLQMLLLSIWMTLPMTAWKTRQTMKLTLLLATGLRTEIRITGAGSLSSLWVMAIQSRRRWMKSKVKPNRSNWQFLLTYTGSFHHKKTQRRSLSAPARGASLQQLPQALSKPRGDTGAPQSPQLASSHRALAALLMVMRRQRGKPAVMLSCLTKMKTISISFGHCRWKDKSLSIRAWL